MDGAQKTVLVANLKRCAQTGKDHAFWFCPKGEDGLPILLVERRKSSIKKLAREERKTARVKTFGYGDLVGTKDGLVFVNDGKVDGAKMLRLFKTKLATDRDLTKIAPLLRTAQVYTREEAALLDREAPDAIAVDVPRALAKDLRRLDKALATLRAARKSDTASKRFAKLQKRLARAEKLAGQGDMEEAEAQVASVRRAAGAELVKAFDRQRRRLERRARRLGADDVLEALDRLQNQRDGIADGRFKPWLDVLDGLDAQEDALDNVDPAAQVEETDLWNTDPDAASAAEALWSVRRDRLQTALRGTLAALRMIQGGVRVRHPDPADELEGVFASLIGPVADLQSALDEAVGGIVDPAGLNALTDDVEAALADARWRTVVHNPFEVDVGLDALRAAVAPLRHEVTP